MKRDWALHLTGSVSLALALFAAGCGKQSVGEVCSTLAGNDDCQDGLVCVAGGQLGRSYDVCCPPDTAAAPTVGNGACNRAPVSVPDASPDGTATTGGEDAGEGGAEASTGGATDDGAASEAGAADGGSTGETTGGASTGEATAGGSTGETTGGALDDGSIEDAADAAAE